MNKTKYALLGQFRRLPICQSSALLTICTKDIDTIDLSMPPVQQQHTAKLQTAKLQALHGLLVTPALPLSNSANHALLRGWLSDLLLVFAPLYSFSSFCALGCVCVFFSTVQKMRIHYTCCKLNMSTSAITINMQTRVSVLEHNL